MTFDADKAAARNTRMWFKLAKLIEASGYEAAGRGFGTEAVRLGRLADWCFWQATGEGDAIRFADLLGDVSGPKS